MSSHTCVKECEVLEALRQGKRAAHLRTHAASCAACEELVLVAGSLQADASSLQPALPSPVAIWWRGHFTASQSAARRATRTITFTHFVGCGFALAVVIAFLMSTSPTFVPAALRSSIQTSIVTGLLAAALLVFPAFYFVWKKE